MICVPQVPPQCTCRLDLSEGTAPPDCASVYEWHYDQAARAWVDWMATVPEYKCNPEQPFAEIVVPTSDTVRYTHVMRGLLVAGSHVLAVGETGTGKTLAIQVRPCFHA